MTLEEVANFHPEDGMVLANTTSVGMKPKIDLTPIPKVCFLFHLPNIRDHCITLNRQESCLYSPFVEEFRNDETTDTVEHMGADQILQFSNVAASFKTLLRSFRCHLHAKRH